MSKIKVGGGGKYVNKEVSRGLGLSLCRGHIAKCGLSGGQLLYNESLRSVSDEANTVVQMFPLIRPLNCIQS